MSECWPWLDRRGATDETVRSAAERRTIAALSAAAEAPAEEPPGPAPPEAGRGWPATPRSSRSPRDSRASRASRARSSRRATSARVAPSRPSRSPTRCRTCVSEPVRQRRPLGGLRAGVHRTAPAGAAQRGPAPGLDAVLDHADRPRRDHGLLHPRRRLGHAALHGPKFSSGLDDLTVGPVPGALPGGPVARPQRPARRGPAVLRPLHDPGDLAGGVERRDHRPAGRAAPPLPRRLRRRQPTDAYAIAHPGGHVRAAADGRSGRSGGSTSACSSRSTGTTPASGRCSC